mmetsp:Transcript_88932/g.185850  ORF Transcript_88932/g.185850 Transcript_88932/m.185850 type:complete len:85 (-) Transcript_88932:1781-2035(-)
MQVCSPCASSAPPGCEDELVMMLTSAMPSQSAASGTCAQALPSIGIRRQETMSEVLRPNVAFDRPHTFRGFLKERLPAVRQVGI